MAEALIQILIVIFSVLLLGGITWTLFWRNPRKLSSRRLAAIDGISDAGAVKRLSVRPFCSGWSGFLSRARAFGSIRISSTFLTDRSSRRDINLSKF